MGSGTKATERDMVFSIRIMSWAMLVAAGSDGLLSSVRFVEFSIRRARSQRIISHSVEHSKVPACRAKPLWKTQVICLFSNAGDLILMKPRAATRGILF